MIIPEDKIVVRKQDILLILDAIGDQWKKSRLKNVDYLLALGSFKLGIHMQRDKTVSKIFGDMIRAINALQQMGAFKELASNENYDDRVEFFRDRLIAEIKSGKFFKGLD